jgi:CRP-like cAMP-binding protein
VLTDGQDKRRQNIRLALYLLVLEARYNKFKPENEGIKIARQDLANLIGATRESLGRSLKEFKDDGFLKIETKTIHILNHGALYKMLDERNSK